MALCSFHGVGLQLLIILSFAYFLQAQIQYHSIAQVPTSWTNNNLSVPSPFGSVRIILLNKKPDALITQNRIISPVQSTISFACGFYSFYGKNYNPTYFAIGLAKISKTETSEEKILSFGNLIWVANRNRPVKENATLELLQDGNLVLKDADGTLVWSAGTSDMSVTGMKMMGTGNLVLYNSKNETVWQSFDHPTDTLLPGQKLKAGSKLVASISKTNWSEGSFYLSVTPQGLLGFYQANDIPQLYFNFSVSQMVESIELNFNASNSLAIYAFSSSSSNEPNPVFTSHLDDASMSHMKFDPDGHLRIYNDFTFKSVDLLADVIGECDYPTACGNYGLCSNAGCSCPQGFVRDYVSNAPGRSGCLEINPATCQNLPPQSLVPYQDVYHFSYIDSDAAILKGTDMESCKTACLKNCSCNVALFQYRYNFSYGNCFLPSPVLSLIRDGKERNNYKSCAFVKVSNKTESKRGSSMTRNEIIAGSTIGTFLLLGLIIALLWILGFGKKDNAEEEGFGGLLRSTVEE